MGSDMNCSNDYPYKCTEIYPGVLHAMTSIFSNETVGTQNVSLAHTRTVAVAVSASSQKAIERRSLCGSKLRLSLSGFNPVTGS